MARNIVNRIKELEQKNIPASDYNLHWCFMDEGGDEAEAIRQYRMNNNLADDVTVRVVVYVSGGYRT